MNDCPFQDEVFSGDDLSGSTMVQTNFRGAELVGTNLSSSNAKNAIFRESDLTCANLRSSTLCGTDFRAADLTLANLKSSGGCNTATFNNAITFCATTMSDGSVRNDDCLPGFDPEDACCTDADCDGETCIDNACVVICDQTRTSTSCVCSGTRVGNTPVRIDQFDTCNAQTCTSDAGCAGGELCVGVPCCPEFGRCATVGTVQDECTCGAPANSCSFQPRCGEPTVPNLRAEGRAAWNVFGL